MMKRPVLTLLLAAALAGALTAFAADLAPTQASDQNYRARPSYQVYFNDYLMQKQGKQHELIFIGDSITEQWRWGAGAPVWQRVFEGRAFNFGQGADKTQHVLWRLENLKVGFVKPKVAVLMIGTNNTGNTPEDIAAGVKAVIAKIQQTFPGVKLIVTSILPNARETDKMAATNRLLAPLADGKTVVYMDLAAKFPPVGDNWQGLSRDKLHLTTEGYETWAAELEAVLPGLLK